MSDDPAQSSGRAGGPTRFRISPQRWCSVAEPQRRYAPGEPLPARCLEGVGVDGRLPHGRTVRRRSMPVESNRPRAAPASHRVGNPEFVLAHAEWVRSRMSPRSAGRKAAGIMRYSPVVATLALFVALGGSAAAVTMLPRDSVGSPQIRKDAVRSPEIAKDAVRAPEIAKDAVRSPEIASACVSEIAADAVRSSEVRDGAIRLADISPHAQHALAGVPGPAGVSEARIAEDAAAGVTAAIRADELPEPPGADARQGQLDRRGEARRRERRAARRRRTPAASSRAHRPRQRRRLARRGDRDPGHRDDRAQRRRQELRRGHDRRAALRRAPANGSSRSTCESRRCR